MLQAPPVHRYDPRMDYDVIVVGGRPAGASLAARLGARGLRVLIVDRATFPSPPAVPSSPILTPATMALLDDLGVDEAAYHDPHGRMPLFRFAMAEAFETLMRVPEIAGRDYLLGVDRHLLDHLLWTNLSRFERVERRHGFAVTDLLRDGDRVVGIRGSARGAAPIELRARAVIGADGRFSLVARRVGAEVVHADNRHCSTTYFAEWTGVLPVHGQSSSAFVCTDARGLDIIFFALPGGRWSINTHARADRVDIAGDPQRYYLEALQQIPSAWRHLAGAQQITSVLGLKQIANGYRRASGPGWALCGDAVHYKDPIDGQGIYDALLGARLLDSALAAWLAGEPWERAMARYSSELWQATHPMFLSTTGRLGRELYQEPPKIVIRTLLRWLMCDPAYQECFLRVLGRDCPPPRLTSPALIAGAFARGAARDLAALLGRAGR